MLAGGERGLTDMNSHGQNAIARMIQGTYLNAIWDTSSVDATAVDALGCLPDAIILADAQARVTYMNPAAELLTGLPMSKARGHVLDKVLTLQDQGSKQPIPVTEFSNRDEPFNGRFFYLASNGGGLIPVQFSVVRTRSEFGPGGDYVVTLRNVSDMKHYIDKLVTQTMHDEHTRLLRRAELIKRLWRLLQESDSDDAHALLYMDLDNFKAINDEAGHAAGDLAIRQVASRLKGVVRERDTLARLGGDEFGLLLEHCPPDLARERAQQLHRAVESYVLQWNGDSYRLGISIGLAIFKTCNHSLNTILARADAACYEAKRHAGDGLHIQEVMLN